IRDFRVTGVQTCALPISLRVSEADPRTRHRGLSHHSATAYGRVLARPADVPVPVGPTGRPGTDSCLEALAPQVADLARSAPHLQIGRASCRERVRVAVAT